ncbi:SIMPL domain-containing protein [Streptomyces sp. NBC_01216]|uniref:SIMPL domain-containing protein n=1 Tax=Streptomyces sp. NBC_01216 TaxID=2903778 RepID=UPI002E10DE16|nr:SIMPL domain-containing protein [Streptomyces sp. NBC_01216]
MTTAYHPTPDTPHLTVRGQAHLEVDPDIAHIGVTVHARGADRAVTLADLTRRNGQVLELLKSYGDAVEKPETGRFSIGPEPRRGRAERPTVYRGQVRVTAELADFTTLGELTARLSDLEQTSVEGPWWALRHDAPAYAEARRLAVTEAVRRARAYAGALGSSLAALLELSDTESSPPSALRHVSGGVHMAFAGEGAEELPSLDLEPQRQTVTAEVTARFTITPPAL